MNADGLDVLARKYARQKRQSWLAKLHGVAAQPVVVGFGLALGILAWSKCLWVLFGGGEK